ncbi:hypothetical protein KKE92_03765 [Candidatus Micrarchaeota archaeon]|nr:hypothetical protein [Candidatus Micrarchaeota archaeon]MBU1681337.1 hypothetical protein [Candidatus Micrarchaeota archaeon]
MVSKKTQIKYCVSDALLLASIERAGEKNGVSIIGIIAIGDYINHSIFTEKELEEGLWRLTEGGWIVEAGERFKVSKKFKDQKIQYISPTGRHSVRKLCPQVRRLLEVDLSCKKGSPSGNLKYPNFTSEKFIKAVKKYQSEF